MTDISQGNLDHKAETIPEQEGLHDYISSSPNLSQTKRTQKDGTPQSKRRQVVPIGDQHSNQGTPGVIER